MSNPQRSLKSVTREDFVRIKELCEESIEVIHRKQCVKQSYPNILSLECMRVYRPGSSQQKRHLRFFSGLIMNSSPLGTWKGGPRLPTVEGRDIKSRLEIMIIGDLILGL